jgi:alpha-galactosidase
MRLLLSFVLAAGSLLAGQSASPLALKPPMGWNSWDSYGLSVTETEYRANVTVMADRLLKYGWQYAVVDEGWYLPNPEAKPGSFKFTLDGTGRYTPALNRFPSAANNAGFKSLSSWVHGQNMKFGIHIIRGIPREAVDKNLPIAGSAFKASDAANKSDTCRWNSDNYGVKANAAGQAYYDSLASLYASWGVDFVKIDCITVPYLSDEIRMFSDALRKTGRPIVLSLSPGPTPPDKVDHLRRYAQMWRISDDFWDRWKPSSEGTFPQGLLGQFDRAATWAPLVQNGHWPDADMLPFGYIGPRPGYGKARNSELTHDEQRTVMTLWSMLRSPLVPGANLTKLDEWTTALLTNKEVIDVDQNAHGARQVSKDAAQAVWVAKPDDGAGAYLALFNLSDAQKSIAYPLQAIGAGKTNFEVRDLWEHKDLGSKDMLKITLPPHGSALFRLR